MSTSFDPGPQSAVLLELMSNYPDASIYPFADFRTEWGPIFYRGRLGGSARMLVIGQDPAQTEGVLRRILVGEAGRRFQGFMAKCGIDTSYIMINTFLYSVYGQTGGDRHSGDAGIAAYRERWIAALLAANRIEAVVALGGLADKAWQHWLQSAAGKAVPAVAYQHVKHPTWPESSSPSKTVQAKNTTQLLSEWNTAIAALRSAIKHPDANRPFVPYGTAFTAADKPDIPAIDLPAGTPGWMRLQDGWASRVGTTPAAKRKTIQITVPNGIIP
ncbi:MAG: uracil-DNA glycosylase [Alphaproteobacteria bacterium]|nr:uracil-DNA glycosylase [Alphaproteobacteria bacterium]MBV9694401.1 uracil-DNA glycosylase [Alphaproteobacteria bacterium]